MHSHSIFLALAIKFLITSLVICTFTPCVSNVKLAIVAYDIEMKLFP